MNHLPSLPSDIALDGIDLGPLLLAAARGEAVERGRPIGFESGRQVAWIDGRFKLVGRGVRGGGQPFAVTG